MKKKLTLTENFYDWNFQSQYLNIMGKMLSTPVQLNEFEAESDENADIESPNESGSQISAYIR